MTEIHSTIDTQKPGTSQPSTPPDLRLLHYNDVYHIESGSAEPAGGIARFQTVVKEYRAGQPELLILFSGDAFNPSLESSVTKGRHMVPFLNSIGTNVACVGNHDLDFGVAQFGHLRDQCNFPWLIANVLDPALGEDVPLANCDKTKILVSNGIKIGVIGLAEREWLQTINALPPNLIYKSATSTAEELVPKLRSQGCEMIIALTHAREPNDIKLAEKTKDGLIDLILGGHDHYYNLSVVKSTHILRSGTDFRQLSYIEARRKENGWSFSITRRDIVRDIPEDPEFAQLVDKLSGSLQKKLSKPVGYTAAPLDGRFTTVRRKESNLGNFVCDLMRHYYNADCTIMAAGTIRGDQIYPPGVLRIKDIMDCFPFEDPVVVLRISGQALRDALENSVCLFPALEGRFPQVSNIIFEYNVDLPSGSRVLWVKVDGVALDKSKIYIVATRGYMAHGKDGFDSLLSTSNGGKAEEVVSEENGILISTMLRQYFLSLKILGKWRRWTSLHSHWNQVQSKLHQNHEVKDSTQPDRLRRRRKTSHNQESKDRTFSQLAPITFRHGGKVEDPESVLEEQAGQDMIDSDSDGSVILDDPPPSKASHPLVTNDSTSDDDFLTHDESDRLYYLARKYGKYWMELAGIDRSEVGMVDEDEGEDIPSWTKGIAPKVEGRIIQSGKKM